MNILVSNYTNKHITFNKGEYVGHLEPTTEDIAEEENLFCVELGSIFSNNRKYFWVRQAFASIQHGFFRSAENADLHSLIGVTGESVVFLFAKNYNLFFNEF